MAYLSADAYTNSVATPSSQLGQSSALNKSDLLPPALLPSETSTTWESSPIAQDFDQDVLGDIKTGFDNFVDSGQVWALLIGLIVGFVVRGLTR